MPREQKITFGEMRAQGVRGLLIYCADHKCSHSTAKLADRWPDHLSLSDIEVGRCRNTAPGWTLLSPRDG